MKHVLVLLPSKQDYDELQSLESAGYTFDFLDDENWRSYEPSLTGFFPLAYVNRCVERVRQTNACGIFYTDDLANFIAAIVAKTVGLAAPSIESMFLANHKLYSRATERSPIRFTGFSFDSDKWRNAVDFPIHVKPVSLFFSLLQTTVHCEKELERAVSRLKASAPEWERPFVELFSHYIDDEKYPLADQHCFLAEEFVGNAISQHAVEGWTDADGVQHIWAVSDNNYFPGLSAALDNNSIPTRLTDVMSQAVCDVAMDTVARFGLKDGFWNVEIWVRDDGKIQVTEVNGRVCSSMTPLYRNVFGKSQYPAALKIACGLRVEKSDRPSSPVGVGAMFAISSPHTGRVRDLLKLEKFPEIRKIPGVVKATQIYGSDAIVNWQQTGGRCCVARAWIVGQDYAEITQKAANIRQELLV